MFLHVVNKLQTNVKSIVTSHNIAVAKLKSISVLYTEQNIEMGYDKLNIHLPTRNYNNGRAKIFKTISYFLFIKKQTVETH